MEHVTITRQQLEADCPFPCEVVADHAALSARAARMIADVILAHNAQGCETSLILPVGPLDYTPLVALCNQERIKLDRLFIYMMDEFILPDGSPVDPSHPLSFQGFMQQAFLQRLDPSLGFTKEQLVFPLPDACDKVSARILGMGGVDLCFCGIGISGHLAFNDPPEPGEGKDLDWVRNCTARAVTLSPVSLSQIVMGGTHGVWEVIPRQAVTLGMKEILASKTICLLGMRAWHAGLVRRALFGPVSAGFPASLLQEHARVEVLLTPLAAELPLMNVTLDVGEAAQEVQA
jgi:glucosamine-6-phosphate deaminase